MALKELMKIAPVRKYLLEDTILDTYEKIFAERGYEQERRKELLDLTNAILDGALPPTEAAPIIQEAFKIDESAAKKLASDVLGYDLLPLEVYVPGIADAIRGFGGKIEDYPATRVGKEKLTPFLWAARMNEAAALGFSDVLVKRLALLLEGRVSGAKDAEALKTFFGRPLAIGGLALPKEKVDSLLVEVEREAPYIEIISEEDWQKMEAKKKAVAEAEAAAAEEISEPEAPASPAPSQEIEIAPTKELAATVPTQAGAMPERLKMAIEATVDAAKEILLAKNVPLEKFRTLAEKNIRGVREPGKTRDILEQEYQLQGADLRVVLDALALGKKQYDGEKKIMEVGEVAQVKEGEEAGGLDQKFAELTKTLPKESIEPISPGARVSAARDAAAPANKKVIPLKPRPAKAELTVGSVPPKAMDRRMTDVVAASRLMGPIDQLKNLSTIEFRRMSSDPAEAAKKIEDLLTALLATSYEERVNGINAWRRSPLNQLYLEISEEALNAGVSIPDICSKRRKDGKDCLSPTEIKAVVALNAKLRF